MPSRKSFAKLFLYFFGLLLFAVRSQALVDVSIGLNFKGSSLGLESDSVPSDCNGTIGPKHFVEFLNGVFAIYNRTNGARVSLSTDVEFWQNAGLTFESGTFISDPRLIFDPRSARWFACEIDVPISTITNRILLAVSKTSDPTEGWRATTIPSDTNLFADFPTMGIDSDALYLAADSFASSETYQGQYCVSIPKSDLLGAIPDASRRSATNHYFSDDLVRTDHPAVNLDGGGPGYILAPENNGVDFQTHTTLQLIQVNGGGSANASFSEPITIQVPPFNVPINPPQPGNPAADPDDGDCRFSAKPYVVNNILYAAHTVDVPIGEIHHSGIRWYKIDVATKSLIQSGTISNALYLFYPSICANSNGVVVINMNGCSSNQFISSYAVVGETVTNDTRFGNLILLKAGTATYDDGGLGFSSRWGDYSALSPDPVYPGHFWAIQNIATGTRKWTTQVSEIIGSEVLSPILSVAPSGNDILLQWFTPSPGFILEETFDLSPPISWTTILAFPISSGGTNKVTVPNTKEMEYFRLRR